MIAINLWLPSRKTTLLRPYLAYVCHIYVYDEADIRKSHRQQFRMVFG